MELTNALVYSLRFAPKLELPKRIIDNIARLRLVPASYKPSRFVKARYVPKRREDTENWREKVLVDCVRKVRETSDPQYDEIFGIFNKIAPSNLDVLTEQALDILRKRDEQFRLRVTTLLFDKAIRGSAFAGVMADLAKRLNNENTEVSGDLEVHVKMFTSLYDMSDTITFPKVEQSDFEEKVIQWSKQKDTRRGYARFLTHLYSRDLVTSESLHASMNKVITDLNDTIVEPKTPQSEENVTQFADFLFEIAKLLKPTAVELRGLILSRVDELLKRPRSELPSLNMRSRFKLEDTIKCVKVC
jgi:hypothetical protein